MWRQIFVGNRLEGNSQQIQGEKNLKCTVDATCIKWPHEWPAMPLQMEANIYTLADHKYAVYWLHPIALPTENTPLI